MQGFSAALLSSVPPVQKSNPAYVSYKKMIIKNKNPIITLSSFQTLLTGSGEAQCWIMDIQKRGRRKKKPKLRLDCKSKINIFNPKIFDDQKIKMKRIGAPISSLYNCVSTMSLFPWLLKQTLGIRRAYAHSQPASWFLLNKHYSTAM